MAEARIMIVEDEWLIASDIKRSLQELGYTVSSMVTSGEEAIKKAEEDNPDLVLMDIVLNGEMDGIEAADQIRSCSGIPVIYITSHSDEKMLERAKITEPFGYIVKPFQDRELHSSIEMALYKHKTEEKLKKSEQWLSTILKSIGDALIVTDGGGLLTFMNPIAETLTGWKQKDALGKNVTEVFQVVNDKTRHYAESPVAKALLEGIVAGVVGDAILNAKNGEEIPIDASASPMRDDEGDITGVVLVFRDISERKELEKQLYHSQKMEALGTLASGIAHEFNNSLGAIQGYAQLVATEAVPSQQVANYIRKIKGRCKSASELTRKMLTYARMDVGEKLPVEVNQVVESVQRLMKQTLSPQIELGTELQEDLPSVMGEPTQLEQVLLNLGLNARDAMPDGGKILFTSRLVEVHERFCGVHHQAKPGRYVVLGVQDTGEGIPLQVLESVFDPFFTTKEPGRGTGLGLSIADSIVKNHGGYIVAESQGEQGSLFLVYLPVMESEREISAAMEAAELPGGNGESVLMVEDDPQQQEIVQKMLESNGYQVTPAENGEEALSLYEEAMERGKAFDVVIMDLAMPVMDGETCLEHLRDMDPYARVIISTGCGEEQIQTKILKQGAYRIMLKPLDFSTLLCQLRNIIEQKYVH